MSRGYEIYVTTAREGYNVFNYFQDDWNQDLYNTTDALGIPRENIIFCCDENKFLHFKEGFLFHLDDDDYELSRIRTHSLIGVDVKNNNWKGDWKALCELKLNQKY